ncbi:hypothetical protein MEQU1_001022 [Malassezia equina]|uniref:Beta-catenin-like protein 1 N-terminal domain-containing protein n=1 Tax=Malassezia equina TaxID=1381935 RepID=A0AAF0EHB5_9BASI|nr:hypothetical protein MEQU1_001022 [Malassezia equina]
MDVGKLFQLPSVSASSVNKRKWGAPPPGAVPAAVADVERVTHAAAPEQPAASKRTRVVDEADTEVYTVGEPEEGDDQEGGRLFGGGLTDEQERILNIMNRDATDGVESGGRAADDVAEARHLLVQLERAIEKNQAMRLKYPDDPRRFIDSEADLDSALRALVLLTTHASVLYPVFLQQGSAVSVVNLLAHDNADMAAAAIQVLEELTDDDVIDAADDAGPASMQALVQVLLDNQVLELLVSNLKRFHDTLPASDDAAAMENYESDRQAVYHTLSVLENLVSLRPSVADELGRATPLLAWLLTRMHRPSRVDQNQAYAAELLAILLHDSDANRAALAPIQGVDTLLQVLARYRHADPHDAEEAEFLENTVDALCASLDVPDNRAQLLESEGLELMILLLRAKRQARSGALKVLDHALSDAQGGAACGRFVEAFGLRALCPVLMRPIEGKGALRAQDMEHLLGIFAALLHNLGSDSLLRTRVLAKFVEQDYAKLDRLLALRAIAVERVEAAAPRLVKEQAVLAAEGIEPADLEALVYARRLESGLYTLQLLDYVLAWLAMEDDHMQKHMHVSSTDLVSTLDVYAAHMDPARTAASGDALVDIIRALRAYLAALSPPRS